MASLLVHLHVYYQDQADYFIEKLKNINGLEWKLIVTYSEPNEEIFEKFRALKPDAEFLQAENCGYDVWPFIKVLKSEKDLSAYDYVLKLHTKRKMTVEVRLNKVKLRDYDWRNELVDAILYSPKQFRKVIRILEKNKRVGMISSLLAISKNSVDMFESRLKEEMQNLGLEYRKGRVNLGTMFIAKSKVLTPLLSPHLTSEYFNDHEARSGSNFSVAHLYERLFSLIPLSLGLKHRVLTQNKKYALRIKTERMIEAPLAWTFTIFRKGEQSRKAIRIFGFEFYIEKADETRSHHEITTE